MYSSSQERSPHWNQYMATLLLTIWSLSLGETSRFLIVLIPYLPQIFLILSQRACVMGLLRYDNVTLGFNFVGSRLGTCSALVINPIRSLSRGSIKPSLHLVQSPFGVFTLC